MRELTTLVANSSVKNFFLTNPSKLRIYRCEIPTVITETLISLSVKFIGCHISPLPCVQHCEGLLVYLYRNKLRRLLLLGTTRDGNFGNRPFLENDVKYRSKQAITEERIGNGGRRTKEDEKEKMKLQKRNSCRKEIV